MVDSVLLRTQVESSCELKGQWWANQNHFLRGFWLWFLALVEMKSEKWPRNAIPRGEKGEKKIKKEGRRKVQRFLGMRIWEC